MVDPRWRPTARPPIGPASDSNKSQAVQMQLAFPREVPAGADETTLAQKTVGLLVPPRAQSRLRAPPKPPSRTPSRKPSKAHDLDKIFEPLAAPSAPQVAGAAQLSVPAWRDGFSSFPSCTLERTCPGSLPSSAPKGKDRQYNCSKNPVTKCNFVTRKICGTTHAA